MKEQYIILWLLIVGFLIGFLTLWNGNFLIKESFATDATDCPDRLIRKENKLYMYNSKHPTQGTFFSSLEEYAEYVNQQKKSGVSCPVLYIQSEYDTQGNEVYRIRPSPFQLDGGVSTAAPPPPAPVPVIDASRENGFNQNMYPGFDPYGMDVGVVTTIDAVHQSTNLAPQGSVNPADERWVGVLGTQQAIDNGVFVDNEVYKITYPNTHPK